jgi:hypothetical protein
MSLPFARAGMGQEGVRAKLLVIWTKPRSLKAGPGTCGRREEMTTAADWTAGSVQSSAGRDVAKAGPSGMPGLTDPNGMELALDIAAPEFQEPPQLGIIGRNVELLPDKALQQIGVIGQMVYYLRRGQAIIGQLLLLVVHRRALIL